MHPERLEPVHLAPDRPLVPMCELQLPLLPWVSLPERFADAREPGGGEHQYADDDESLKDDQCIRVDTWSPLHEMFVHPSFRPGWPDSAPAPGVH
jgi:hypothetical protein